jgi:phage regulator Rha-like protein
MCKDLIQIVNDEMVMDSREISEMVNMEHWKVLRKLEGTKKDLGIIPVLADNDFVVGEYFIKENYKDANNQERPCYKFTKMGCEMFANKLTGEKGIVFSAKYVKAFNSMESYIKGAGNQQLPANFENMLLELQTYYKPTHKQKLHICNYIKRSLGIQKANDEYELIKENILLKLDADKWQDVSYKQLQDMKIVNESINEVVKNRKETEQQLSMFDGEVK